MLKLYFISSLLYSRVQVIFHIFLSETCMNINENDWIWNTSENYIWFTGAYRGFNLQFFYFFFNLAQKIKVLSNQNQLIPVPRKLMQQTLSTLQSFIIGQNLFWCQLALWMPQNEKNPPAEKVSFAHRRREDCPEILLHICHFLFLIGPLILEQNTWTKNNTATTFSPSHLH